MSGKQAKKKRREQRGSCEECNQPFGEKSFIRFLSKGRYVVRLCACGTTDIRPVRENNGLQSIH